MTREFLPLRACVLTVSDTRTEATDTSGGLAIDLLTTAGHRVVARRIVADDEHGIRAVLQQWIEGDHADVIIVTGGTGVTARDVTPEALQPLIRKPIPGFGELFRHLSFAEIGASTIQSRAEAALCGNAFVFLLPGSTGGVRLAMEQIIVPQLDHRTTPCNFAMLLPRVRRG